MRCECGGVTLAESRWLHLGTGSSNKFSFCFLLLHGPVMQGYRPRSKTIVFYFTLHYFSNVFEGIFVTFLSTREIPRAEIATKHDGFT